MKCENNFILKTRVFYFVYYSLHHIGVVYSKTSLNFCFLKLFSQTGMTTLFLVLTLKYFKVMAEGKKSFVAYTDWKDTFDALTDEKAGALIKHIYAYVSDENPITDDMLINAVFANIKNTLKRDLKKWETQHNQRIKAGKKSAEVRKQNATSVNERSISSTVSVSVSDSVSVNELIPTTEKIKKIDVVYSLFVKEIKEGYHTQWAEQTYMQLGLKKGALTPLINNFKSHLIRSEKFHETVSQFKDHLNNWLNNLDSIGKLNEYKLKSIGAL